MYTQLPFLIIPLVAAFVLIAAFRPLAHYAGLVDVPGGHKNHHQETPLVGGLAIALAVIVMWGLLSVDGDRSLDWWKVLAPSAILVAVGIIDDRRALSVRARFFTQFLAAMLLVHVAGAVVGNLGDLVGLGPIDLHALAVPFTVFAVVGSINAVNMSDGMDGLAGSLVAVSYIALAVVASVGERSAETTQLLILVGAVGGFLLFNIRLFGRQQAAVFMGDAGSMFLGFMFAYYLIVLAQGPDRAMNPVVALWIFGLPLIDTVSTMTRRLIKGKSPFQPDNEHLHHIFTRAGFSVNQALLIIVSGHALLCAIGLGAYYAGAPDYYSFAAFVAISLGYFVIMTRAWRVMRTLHRWRG